MSETINLSPSEPNNHKDSNETFWKWLINHSWLLISQVTVVLSLLGLVASSIYYISHGKFSEYMEADRIQNIILWMHLIILAIFIGWLLWIRDEKPDDEKARKTVRSVFRRDIKNAEAIFAQAQLKKFKSWFLVFWCAMFCLYLAFCIQPFFVSNSEKSPSYSGLTSREKSFSMFEDISKINKEYNEKNADARTPESQAKFRKDLEEKINELKTEIDESGEYNIYSKIKNLKPNQLELKIDNIINQLKNPTIDTALKHNNIILAPANAPAASQTPRRSRNPVVSQTPVVNENPKYKVIYDDIWQADEVKNEAKRNEYIEQARGKVTALLQNNPLNEQERKIFNDIKNLNPEEFNNNINEIVTLIEAAKKNKKSSELTLVRTIFVCTTYILNTFGLWIIFVLYLLTFAPDENFASKEKKYRDISFVFFIILSLSSLSLFAILKRGASETEFTTWIVFFDGLSGILNAVALALLIARLDSKLIGLPSVLIGILYFYAAIQPLFVVFEQPGEISQLIKTVVFVVVFISKIYFFLIITYAIQSGRILTYLYCYPIVNKRVDMIYANPFRIEGTEFADRSEIKIFRNEKEVFSDTYSKEESIGSIIDEIQLWVEKENESEEKYVRLCEIIKDKYQIKIFSKNGKTICEGAAKSMTKTEADKLRIDAIKYIPFCDPEITNKGKHVQDSNNETTKDDDTKTEDNKDKTEDNDKSTQNDNDKTESDNEPDQNDKTDDPK